MKKLMMKNGIYSKLYQSQFKDYVTDDDVAEWRNQYSKALLYPAICSHMYKKYIGQICIHIRMFIIALTE